MKKSTLSFCILSMVCLGFIGCVSSEKNTNSNEKIGSWSGGMRAMAHNLEALMPYVFSHEEFRDSENHKKIEVLIAGFKDGVEQVPGHLGEALMGKDPIVQYSISRMKMNSQQALQAFSDGQIEYSRSVLRENMGVCFSCHTTQSLGPQNQFSDVSLGSSFRISPVEKADFYVATRQFDKALTSLNRVVQSPAGMEANLHEQLAALRKYLFLQVRVKSEPKPAISLLNKYLTWEKLPHFVAADVRAWLDSLKMWQREGEEQNSIRLAHNLINKANSQQLDGYQSGLVDYLRASKILHESLLVAKESRKKAEIYLMLGESYETLSEMGVWDLPEVYFEACVRTYPNSSQAKKCYKAFERSIILGYSGSGGVFIPDEERRLMHELSRLAGFTNHFMDSVEDSDEE